LVEHWVVVPDVAGSNPVTHPICKVALLAGEEGHFCVCRVIAGSGASSAMPPPRSGAVRGLC
jgi:hypothetical protein